jgi:LPXTG-motif cell wall-anchored protein
MKILYKIATLLIMAFWGVVLPAQMETSIKLDSSAILIGGQTILEIGFASPPAYAVQWPELSDTITSQIEIVRKTAPDSTMSNDRSSRYLFQKLTITSFDSGFLVIPPVTIGYRMPGDTTLYVAETEALLLEVQTISVNLEGDFRDIKDPMAAPFTFREALPYILAFLAILLLILGGIYLWKKRKKAEPVFIAPLRPGIPAYQIALDSLEALRQKKLWQAGLIKDYHTELTDIVREYLSARFNIHAHELTSEEILDSVNTTSINGQAKEKLRQILSLADMVKFAKLQPTPVEHDNSLNGATGFVRETHQETDTRFAYPAHIVPQSEVSLNDFEEKRTEQRITNKTEGGQDVE